MWSQVGPQPIQISEIEALLRLLDVRGREARMKYVRLIKRMDAVELNFLHKKSKVK
jgi:hypothetical protein